MILLSGYIQGLVEAEIGNVGFLLRKRQAVDFVDVAIVTLGLVEGEGEVLNAVIRITSDTAKVAFLETILALLVQYL